MAGTNDYLRMVLPDQPTPGRQYVTATQAAEVLHVRPRNVRTMVQNGAVAGYTRGNITYVEWPMRGLNANPPQPTPRPDPAVPVVERDPAAMLAASIAALNLRLNEMQRAQAVTNAYLRDVCCLLEKLATVDHGVALTLAGIGLAARRMVELWEPQPRVEEQSDGSALDPGEPTGDTRAESASRGAGGSVEPGDAAGSA